MKIYLDGKFVDQADAKVSVFDHGLLYGDGVFEGIRLYQGNIFRLDEHLERLEMSAKALLDGNPKPSREDIKQALNGNLCRCGTHMRIVRAIERVAKQGAQA